MNHNKSEWETIGIARMTPVIEKVMAGKKLLYNNIMSLRYEACMRIHEILIAVMLLYSLYLSSHYCNLLSYCLIYSTYKGQA